MDHCWILLMFALVSSAVAESCTECGLNTPCQCVRARDCRLSMDVLRPCQKLFCCPEEDILQNHKRIVAWPKYQSLRKLNYIAGSWIKYPPGQTRTRTTTAPPETTTAPGDDDCGVRTVDGRRISVGNETGLGQYPWVVALRYRAKRNESDVRNMCGGSLITRQHVLTAAHCVKNVEIKGIQYDLIAVVAGEHDITRDPDCMVIKDKQICSFIEVVATQDIITPTRPIAFNTNSLKNDIAVLKLERELPLTDFIRPICLPSGDSQLAVGGSVLIAGWGRTIMSSAPSPVLLHASVDVQDFGQCVSIFRKRDKFVYSPQMFCAGLGKVDSCTGDSGGPLMNVIDDKFYVMGIVSFGDDRYCGLPDVPGVYTNVTNYLDFIRKSII